MWPSLLARNSVPALVGANLWLPHEPHRPFASCLDQPGPIDNGNDFWFIPAATDYADTHDWVYSIVLWLSIFFFILIVGVMVKFAFDYRRRSNFDRGTRPHPQCGARDRVDRGAFALSAGLFLIGIDTYADFKTAPANCYEVDATAQSGLGSLTTATVLPIRWC